jgi:type VI secretion system protein VasD
MKTRAPFPRAAMVGLALALGACGTVGGLLGGEDETTVEAQIFGTAKLNADTSGKASPLTLYIYELTSPEKFMALDYFALTATTPPGMEANVVTFSKHFLEPNQTVPLTWKPQQTTTALGFVGTFQQEDNIIWRVVRPLEIGEDNSFEVTIDDKAIAVR